MPVHFLVMVGPDFSFPAHSNQSRIARGKDNTPQSKIKSLEKKPKTCNRCAHKKEKGLQTHHWRQSSNDKRKEQKRKERKNL